MLFTNDDVAGAEKVREDSAPGRASPVIRTRGLERRYSTPAGPVFALRSVDLDIPAGQFVGLVGTSGSGKSTLLNMLSAVDWPSEGSITVAGTDLLSLGTRAATRWRGMNCGVVLQSQQLIPLLTAHENVRVAMDFAGVVPRRERNDRAQELLDSVGLDGLAYRFPDELSGGQQQRVAIARALANRPPLLVADEPTASLDSATGSEIAEMLASLAHEHGTTVVCSTHDEAFAERTDRILRIADGNLI